MRSFSMGRLVKKVWIPLLLVVVLAVSGLVVSRLHAKFGSENLNAHAGAGIEIVQFNPKVVVYEVFGTGTTATINYTDLKGLPQRTEAPLPWSIRLETTIPSVQPNLLAQGDGSSIGCRVTVDGEVKDERTAQGVNAATFCLVKAA